MYILGNLLGRAIVSYVLVWVICFLFSRFQWKLAFKRSRRWYSILAVIMLTMLGIGGAISKNGGLV